MVAQCVIGLNLQLIGAEEVVGLGKVGDELSGQHCLSAHVLLVVQSGVGLEFRPGLRPGSRLLLLLGEGGSRGSRYH